ncbi:hypothetical protein [Natrinema salaciae]|uniref:Uncharacterized protein n=1 Tax=Natrinema salaciae TaxID=1186196 RepID=A0A1H9FCB7_9EURY|nr:hypothetical protein [Natrinema salaciae]SEQ34948.1 hypothetical protein SAMN04489841_1522 [Natrinema salaciae]
MPAHGTTSLEQVGAFLVRVLVSGLACYLAIRVADGFFAQLAAAVFFTIVLTTPWELVNRLGGREPSDGE